MKNKIHIPFSSEIQLGKHQKITAIVFVVYAA